MKIILFIIGFLLCNQSVFAQKTGAFVLTFPNSGIESNLYMYVPEDYDSTKAYPMLWAWHGGGMSGEVMLSMMAQIRNRVKVIIVCPDINNVTTEAQFGYIYQMSYLYPKKYYHVDTTKIIITGASAGGFYAYQIGLTNPQLVKGIIGLAPAIGLDNINQNMWDNITKVRMATILGTLDDSYNIINGLMTEIKNRNGSLLLVEKQGLDHMGSNGYYSTNEFIDDFMNCYNYIMGEASEVKDGQQYESETIVTVYPNPASDYLSINTGVNDEFVGEIKIYNTLGDCVVNLKQATHRVDISMLEPGVYSLVVYNGAITKTNQFVVAR